MTIRDATPDDVAAIHALHAGQDYPLPALDSRLLSAQVVERDGRVVAAVMAVRAAEIVMVLDRETLTPGFRWEAVKALHVAMERQLAELQVDCAYCWIAPQYAKGFRRRLMRLLGWSEPTWRCLQRKVRQ